MRILNIGAGKIKPLKFEGMEHSLKSKNYPYDRQNIIVNLDSMYFNSMKVSDVEEIIKNFHTTSIGSINCNHDIYDFLEKFSESFDHVCIYRFLEHVPKVKILYFLYILSTVMNSGSLLDIIVPDYKKLAKRILEEDVTSLDFERDDIITTFELLNEPYCPHASIWTIDRLYHFLQLEGRFIVQEVKDNYKFDGRDIYLRAIAKRV